jgi:ankyrin repeat protein
MCMLSSFYVCIISGLSQSGWTPLICAAENGQSDCVRLLLDAGAETETHDVEVRLDVLIIVCVIVFYFLNL